MRGSVDTLALGVLDPLRGQGDDTAVRLQHLDGIPQVELAALGAVGYALVPAVHRADEVPVPHIGVAGGLLGLLLAEVEARRIVAVAGTVQLLDDIIGQLKIIIVGVAQVGIQCAAVGAGDRRNIVKRLGASLDLQAVHACLADQIDKRRGAKVVGVQDIAAVVLALTDLHILAGAVLLDQVILPAAGLGALTPVAAAACHIAGQQAPAGDAHAHGTVNESFQFQVSRAVIADEGDLGQGQFTGQHHALGAQFVADLGGLVVGDARLGGDMALHLGSVFFGQRQHTQVGNDKGIDAGLGGILDILGQLVQLLVGGQGVQRQIDLFAAGVGEDAALVQLAHRQVDRGGPHAEFRQSAVDSVRAVHDGVFQSFQAAGGGQQFRLLQHGYSSVYKLDQAQPALTQFW